MFDEVSVISKYTFTIGKIFDVSSFNNWGIPILLFIESFLLFSEKLLFSVEFYIFFQYVL